MAEKYVSKGISVTFSTLDALLLDVNHSGEMADQVDVTDQASANQWREFQSGFKDGGELVLSLLFDPDASLPAIGTQATLTVDWPSGTTNAYAATANLSKRGVAAPLGEKITMDLTFKITSEPDWAA